MSFFVYYIFTILLFATINYGEVLNYESMGAIPGDDGLKVMKHNHEVLSRALNSLNEGDVFIVPEKIFNVIGGIVVEQLYGARIEINGELKFSDDRETWPTNRDGHVLECLDFKSVNKTIFTSRRGDGELGVLNGNGRKWWGAINFLKNQENRPRLFHVRQGTDWVFERLLLKDSPFWSFYAESNEGLVIRYAQVDARITDLDHHTPLDLTAFNTDGFDVTGNNIHIHDVKVWNQDDCVCIKDGTTNVLVERVEASGLGLVIGSIGSSVVRNVTFRDCFMHRTFKGIYMKTRWSDDGPAGMDVASISDIVFENITMYEPQQYPIWIGPAQQTGQPCSLAWPQYDDAKCIMSGYQTWQNILLKDITIIHPRHNPGVLIANSTNPMKNVVFDNVIITNPGHTPFDGWYCDSLNGYAIGHTAPVPQCFVGA